MEVACALVCADGRMRREPAEKHRWRNRPARLVCGAAGGDVDADRTGTLTREEARVGDSPHKNHR